MTHAMPGPVLRQGLALALLSAALLLPAIFPRAAAGEAPRLLSILAATVTTPAIETSVDLYRDALGYRVVERGVVSPALARSWGAPAMAGRAQAVLAPASGEAVFLRLVAGTPVPHVYHTSARILLYFWCGTVADEVGRHREASTATGAPFVMS